MNRRRGTKNKVSIVHALIIIRLRRPSSSCLLLTETITGGAISGEPFHCVFSSDATQSDQFPVERFLEPLKGIYGV